MLTRCVQLSTDRRQVLVLCGLRLHLFNVFAEDDRPDPVSGRPSALREVSTLTTFRPKAPLSVYCRDGHVLVVPRRRGGLCVLDMGLNLLYRVQTGFCTTLYFVGEDLYVTDGGQVVDWRRRRRYLGQISMRYNVLLRLNRQ